MHSPSITSHWTFWDETSWHPIASQKGYAVQFTKAWRDGWTYVRHSPARHPLPIHDTPQPMKIYQTHLPLPWLLLNEVIRRWLRMERTQWWIRYAFVDKMNYEWNGLSARSGGGGRMKWTMRQNEGDEVFFCDAGIIREDVVVLDVGFSAFASLL